MSNARRGRCRPYLNQVNKFIGEFPDLFYDGVKIICKVCDKPLMCWDRRDCRVHISSLHHQDKRKGAPSRSQFKFDLLLTLIACDVPLAILDKQPFRKFWNKYNSQLDLPGRTTLRGYIPAVHEHIVSRIKCALKNTRLWLSVEERTDCKSNSIVNIIVRVLDPIKPTFPLLLASKRLTVSTGETITRVVLETFEKFELSTSQVLMLVTEDAPTMHLVGYSLQTDDCRFLHVLCKVHALHLVAETIRMCFPEVDALIASTKKVFFKSPKRLRAFHRQCPGIPEPPQLVLTRWQMWLKAAFYYAEYFQQIKAAILQFNPDDAAAIRESQTVFQVISIETDLETIHKNYKGLHDAIDKLQNKALSLVESLQIVDDVNTQLRAINDAKHKHVGEKFESMLRNDPDFSKLRQICGGTATASLIEFAGYFSYAGITSVDIERKYKHIFSPQRTSLTEATVETYLMLHSYYRSAPICDKDNHATS